MEHLKFKKNWFKTTLTITAMSFIYGCGGSDNTNNTAPTPTPPTENRAPVITSSPSLIASEDVTYNYQVIASDPDTSASSLVYSLVASPQDMSITTSGLISWSPVEGVLTSDTVTLKVAESADANALSVTQSFTIQVNPVNDQLEVLPATQETVSIDSGATFSQQIEVTDVDDQNNGTDIVFSLVQAPDGMTISSTGLITWTPDLTQSTLFNVSVTVSDGGEDNTSAVPFNFDIDVLVYQSIQGNVANYFTGQSLGNVAVRLSDGATTIATSTTDSSGEYVFTVLDRLISERLIISSALDEFADAAFVFSGEDSALESQFITMLPSDVSSDFDPSLAHNVTLSGINLVEFPANSLSRKDGLPIQGNVTAQVTVIDPSSDINVMPGEMVTLENGELFLIESFGAIDVVLADESNAPVNVSEGQLVTIRIPLGTNSSNPPATIPLYYFDATQGAWLEEGSASLTSDAGQTFYQGQVSHFTTWNADQKYNTVFIDGCVVDIEGQPISDALIRAKGRDYSGASSARTDSAGSFSIPVRRSSSVLLSGSDGNLSRTLTINVLEQDVTIQDCIELSAATATVTLSWGLDPDDLDTHFFGPADELGNEFHVYYSNKEVLINDTNIYLDVDDVSSFGPEILTIPNFPFAGRYQYVVHKFSGSSDILLSPTRVEINLGNQTRIFSPNDGNVSRDWHVFDFVVNEAGNIVIEEVNQWISSVDDRITQVPLTANQAQQHKRNLKQNAVKNKYYKQ
jgi:uncharacterized protein YfaP (DUF2135 family)